MNQFVEFNNYVNSPVANYKGELYNLPFNMNTFTKMWGVVTPKEAAEKIAQQIAPKQASRIQKSRRTGHFPYRDGHLYEAHQRLYGKAMGRSRTEPPAFIIKRLPVRYTFDNNYFNDRYQGIPVGGYNKLIEGLLAGIEVRTGVDYLKHRDEYKDMAKRIVYTGPIDEYFGYKLGPLEYRGLRFETERLEEENHQGVAVMNYTDHETPWTRIIEHKHFEFGTQPVTYVTKEYPADWRTRRRSVLSR